MAKNNSKYFFILFIGFFKLCKKNPRMALLAILLVVGWQVYERQIARPAMSFQGVPKTQHWQQPKHWFRVLRNKDFMLGYSDLRGNPLWVTYKVSPVDKNATYYSRPQRFSKDWRVLSQMKHDDYLNSGYDRGHMAPNYAISRLYGKQAQLDTFLMSNITPQLPTLNRKLWQRLEEVEVKYFTALDKEVWVLTGPIFDNETTRLKSAWKVEIPDAFYKIYALPQASGIPRLLAFLMPQKVKGYESLDQFLTTVDKIEELTGLDFFSDLDDSIEEKLESMIESTHWNLKKVARLPSRY